MGGAGIYVSPRTGGGIVKRIGTTQAATRMTPRPNRRHILAGAVRPDLPDPLTMASMGAKPNKHQH